MRSRRTREKEGFVQNNIEGRRRGIAVFFSLVHAVLGAWHAIDRPAAAMGSDVQRATNESAVEAKTALCMALNRKQETGQLTKQFFDFYEGKTIVAPRLSPQTFRTGQIGPIPDFEVRQVTERNKMLVSINGGICFLEDASTADIADGQSVTPSGWFRVCQTETYTTVAGSTKTVYILKPCPDTELPKVTVPRAFPWYDKKDNIVVTGEFKRIEGAKAVFAVNGVEEAHGLSKFTQGDRDLLRMIWKRYPPDEPVSPVPQSEPAQKASERYQLD